MAFMSGRFPLAVRKQRKKIMRQKMKMVAIAGALCVALLGAALSVVNAQTLLDPPDSVTPPTLLGE